MLIIDNDALDIELLLNVLAEMTPQAKTTVFQASQDALEYLLEDGYGSKELPLVDLVLLDINMPQLSGFEVLATLRADPRTQPLNIVLFSTSDDPNDQKLGLELGADGYLVKPPKLEQLEKIMREVISRWA